jgi:hypothetical protein
MCGSLARGQPVSETEEEEVTVQANYQTVRLDYYKIILKTILESRTTNYGDVQQ